MVTVDGCASEIALTEVVFSPPPVAEASNNGPYCEGDPIELLGNTNTPGNSITYTWNGPNGYESFDQNPNDALEPGSYELIVNVDGCVSQIEITEVLVNASPQPEISGQSEFCTGNSATIDAGDGYTNYIWDDASTNQTLEVFDSGTYFVTVTDDNGCTGEDSFEVTENASLSPTITGTLEFCEGSNTVLDAGDGFSIYEWSTGEMTQTIEVFDGGNYGVLVTDDDGCTGSANVTTAVNDNPEVIIGGSTSYCIGGFTILDAGAGYDSYNWSNDSTSQTITVSTPGDYSVDIVDSNGCTGFAEVNIIESTSLNPVITGDNAFCENGNTILNAGSGFDSYLWSDGSTEQSLTVDIADDYSVTVSDAQGCTGENTITITEVLPPSAELQTETELCNTEAGGSILNLYDLIISGDINGSWEDADNSGAVGLFNNLNFNNIAAGDYNFIYTTNSAIFPCPETEYQVVVTVIDCTCPDVFFFNADPLCNGGDVLDLSTIENTDETGNWSIIQTPPGINPATLNGTNFDATAGDPGEYILQFDLQNQPPPGCPTDFQVIVNVDPEVNAGVAAQPVSYCFNENEMVNLIDLIAGSDLGGSWTETSAIPSQGTAFDPASGTFETNGQISGNYTFEYTVTSAGVCPDDGTEVSVVINELPTATVANFVVLDCINTIQSLDASGSSFGLVYDIAWAGPGVLLDGNENSLNPNVDQPGVYQLTVTNTLTGCSAQTSTEVNSDTNPPLALAGNDDAITCNEPIITLQAGGDIGSGFEIEWSGPAINAGNMNDPAPQVDLPGTYILSITNLINSCVSNPDTLIIFDETASPDIFTQFPTSELDCNNPSISLTGGSADQNVSFQWLDPNMVIISSTEIANNIMGQGNYTLVVTNNATGCTSTEIVAVIDNTDFPSVNIGSPAFLDCINTTEILDGTGSSSGPEIEYSWSGPVGGIMGTDDEIMATAILAGTYTLIVTNTENGCSSSDQVILQQNIDLPEVQIATPDELDCSVDEVTLDATGSSEGNEFVYSWQDAQGAELSNALSFITQNPGFYELIVANTANGCTNSSSVTVFENSDIPTSAFVAIQDPSCFGDQDGSINVEQVIGGTPPYLFSLNNTSFINNNFYTNLAAGSYELALEDANGCRWDTLIFIQEPAALNLDLGPDIELGLGESATVQAQVNLPSNQIDTLIWSPDDLVNCIDPLCLEGIISTFNTVSLSATVFDENGFRDSDDLTIVMRKERRIFIPTAFSPNGDGTNDTFTIFCDDSQIEAIHKFSIFNRWGEVVFEAENFEPNDPTKGWDGNFKNERMNPGVFVYFAEVEFIDGFVEVYKGDVTLMK
jgi:gliding motility-associated-like protein